MKLNIGFDIDGVLYDWHRVAHDYARNFLGVESSYENFWKGMRAVYGKIWKNNLVGVRHLYEKLAVYKDVIDTLNYFSKNNALYYITHRDAIELGFVTEVWMDRNKIPQSYNLFFTKDKRIEISKLELDYFIEDKDTPDYRNFTNMILVKKLWNKKSWDKYTTIDHLSDLKEIIGE